MIAIILIFLAWGSHLNSIGYRLLNLKTFFKVRSFCPKCLCTIAWYDNIPLFSWLILEGKCRTCKQHISFLYPSIELMTTISLYCLWKTIPANYFLPYFLFFSALIVSFRTDCEKMLISRFATLYLIPIGIIAAFYDKLPISCTWACLGTCFGYFLLWCVKKLSYLITKKDCLGQGDLELLAFIGAFTGPLGVWISLTIGSMLGTIMGILYTIFTAKKIEMLPLGAFLSFGAIIFTLFQKSFLTYIFYA